MFVQVLAAYVAPEGAYAIASRNLLFVAREENDREGKIRSTIKINQYVVWSVLCSRLQSYVLPFSNLKLSGSCR